MIGFVASGFRKDKIWLRRTKPMKRNYQVMIMLDNSESMGAAGPLAMSSLCVIATALSRLEIGEIAVTSFADTVEVLHPFSQPFTDESGANVYSHFGFNKDRTFLASSLSSVLPVFEQSRANSSGAAAATCLQLCFVISDARIDSDNRDKLNTLIRDMTEQHILVVLIIIDNNDDPKDSILQTRSVSFTDTGKIETKSYLDEFPFPYYIVVQQMSSLPDVLTETLKQWFELVHDQLG